MPQRNQTSGPEEKSQNTPKSRKEDIIKLNTPGIKGKSEGDIIEQIIEQINRINKYKLDIKKEEISRLTIDTIQKGEADGVTMGHINEALSSFIEVQKNFEYVKKDFSNMKTFIEKIKGNELLTIEEGGTNIEFERIYNSFWRAPQEGEIYSLLTKFMEAEYTTFNSKEISTSETRGQISPTEKDSLQYRRQSLIELLSYLYITKKKEMDTYFYNIEKLYELSKYNVNDTQDEERDFSSDVTRRSSRSTSRDTGSDTSSGEY